MVTRLFAMALVVATAASGNSWVLSDDGIGPVRIGMTLAELNSVLHEHFAMPTAGDDRPCFYVTPTSHPDVGFMIEDGRLTRIDVDGPQVPSAAGVRVGDSEQKAIEVYRHMLTVKPGAYTGPEGHYLTQRSNDRRYGIRFETDEGKIVRFYAGRFSSVQYIEGCQ